MMSPSFPTLFDITEGWTSPLDTQLQLDGAAFDASGMSVASEIHGRDGVAVVVTTTWQIQATSVARLALTAGQLTVSKTPYTVKFKVTDGSGKIAYFPSGDPMFINVFPA